MFIERASRWIFVRSSAGSLRSLLFCWTSVILSYVNGNDLSKGCFRKEMRCLNLVGTWVMNKRRGQIVYGYLRLSATAPVLTDGSRDGRVYVSSPLVAHGEPSHPIAVSVALEKL